MSFCSFAAQLVPDDKKSPVERIYEICGHRPGRAQVYYLEEESRLFELAISLEKQVVDLGIFASRAHHRLAGYSEYFLKHGRKGRLGDNPKDTYYKNLSWQAQGGYFAAGDEIDEPTKWLFDLYLEKMIRKIESTTS